MLEQHVLALELAAREGGGGLLVAHIGLRGGDLGAPASRSQILVARLRRADALAVPLDGERGVAQIQPREHVAGLDPVALAHEHFDDASGDLGREVHEGRLDATVEVNDPAVVFGAAAGKGRGGSGDEREARESIDESTGSSAFHRFLPRGGTFTVTIAPRVQTSSTVSR